VTKPADLLLTNAIVLTMDEGLNSYEPGAVAIGNHTILAAGSESELTGQFTAKEMVDCGGKVLMPGLVLLTPYP
jgi:predicted amidohydrolase YtcJ